MSQDAGDAPGPGKPARRAGGRLGWKHASALGVLLALGVVLGLAGGEPLLLEILRSFREPPPPPACQVVDPPPTPSPRRVEGSEVRIYGACRRVPEGHAVYLVVRGPDGLHRFQEPPLTPEGRDGNFAGVARLGPPEPGSQGEYAVSIGLVPPAAQATLEEGGAYAEDHPALAQSLLFDELRLRRAL